MRSWASTFERYEQTRDLLWNDAIKSDSPKIAPQIVAEKYQNVKKSNNRKYARKHLAR